MNCLQTRLRRLEAIVGPVDDRTRAEVDAWLASLSDVELERVCELGPKWQRDWFKAMTDEELQAYCDAWEARRTARRQRRR